MIPDPRIGVSMPCGGGAFGPAGARDADLYSGTAAHDVAAVCLLVREAGGTVTDRTGMDQRYDRPVNGCLLSNGTVHNALVEEWRRVYRPRTGSTTHGATHRTKRARGESGYPDNRD